MGDIHTERQEHVYIFKRHNVKIHFNPFVMCAHLSENIFTALLLLRTAESSIKYE